MSRAVLTVSDITRAGVLQTLAAPAAVADGNSFPNTGREILVITNADAGVHTFTIQTPGKVDDLDVAERTLSVTNGTTKIFGPFPPGTYNQADRSVYLDCVSSITGITVGVFRI